MSGNSFPVKRLAMTVVAFAVVAVAGVATLAIIPALAAGTCQVKLASTLTPGNYQLRLFNYQGTLLDTSNPISVN